MSNLANKIKKAKTFCYLRKEIVDGLRTAKKPEEQKFFKELIPIINFHYHFHDCICKSERVKGLLKDIKELSNNKEYKNNSDISKIVKEIEKKINELHEDTKKIQEKHDILTKYSYRELYNRMEYYKDSGKPSHYFKKLSHHEEEELEECIEYLSTLRKKKYKLIEEMKDYLDDARKTDATPLITEFDKLFNDTKQLEVDFEGLEECITGLGKL